VIISPRSIPRRSFIKSSAQVLAAVGLGPKVFGQQDSNKRKLFTSIGIAASPGKAAFLKAQGIDFLTCGVGELLMPDQPEDSFEKKRAELATCPLPILACNGFIRPAHLHCVGPEANHDLVLEWADISFRRLKKLGGKFIVFGSAGARRVPDGWPIEKADEQFISLLKQMGPLAAAQEITVTIEQLRAAECDFINQIKRAADLIRAANHPNIRLLADLYHMAVMNDGPADLKAAMDVVAHIEIAEKNARTAPGVKGDDFRPFFRVLREANYQGAISIEGKYEDSQLANAVRTILQQASEV